MFRELAARRIAVVMIGTMFATGFTACARDSDDPAASRSVEAIADDYLAALLERYPEFGTYYGMPDAANDRLFDNSLAALEAWHKRENGWLAELDSIVETPSIGSRDWVTFGILRETLFAEKEARICRSELWHASGTTAWHTNVPSLFELQPVDTPEQRQHVLDRLRRVSGYVDTEIANLRLGLSLGYSAPKISVMTVPDEVRALLANDSPFLSPAKRSGDNDFSQVLTRMFEKDTAPAIERFARYIESEYQADAREDIALSANPQGSECYPALVRLFSTLHLDAAEIHRIGLEQMAQIHEEMRLLIEEHFGGESVKSFLARLNTDPEFTFRSEDEVLRYSLNSLDAAKAKMPQAFGHVPKADVVIEPYPAYRASGTGEYQSSSEDGTRPGIYYIAVSDPEHRSRAGQQSVLYHETWPGHHLQGAIALELGDSVHPLARYLGNSGYGEGWGLYSERLADELGLYSSPLDRMGMLSDQAARAARLVIDTGIHTMGWTRRQSVDYMRDNTAWPFVDIESEINRYISWPGQATAYMLGMLELRRLRALAEARLGAEFDLPRFHDRVLENGSVTLPMLDKSVSRWIEEQL